MDMVRRAIETDSVVFGETVCIAPPCARHAAETLSRWIGQLRENRAVAEVGANTGETMCYILARNSVERYVAVEPYPGLEFTLIL